MFLGYLRCVVRYFVRYACMYVFRSLVRYFFIRLGSYVCISVVAYACRRSFFNYGFMLFGISLWVCVCYFCSSICLYFFRLMYVVRCCLR